ncbi:MAG: hypothetical protein NZ473_09340, partial [Candidatus Kapabacteria bacterium]|nr:hypothetical protein [Candidatus Kapabacteria bacterium]
AGAPVPPAMIVVCDNTDLAKLVYKHIAKGNVLPELANREGEEVTFRIDTKLLAEAESAVEGETRQQAAERLRKTVETVGKTEWDGEGEPPGKNIRCGVSVGMLTEGWDARASRGPRAASLELRRLQRARVCGRLRRAV